MPRRAVQQTRSGWPRTLSLGCLGLFNALTATTGCAPKGVYSNDICPWEDSARSASGEILAVRETSPGLARSTDGGKVWRFSGEPKCSGIFLGPSALVCWQGANHNRSMTSRFQLLASGLNDSTWHRVDVGDTRRHLLLFGRYLMMFGVRDDDPMKVLDLSTVGPDGGLASDAVQRFANIREAEAWIERTVFPPLPTNSISVARNGEDCWAFRGDDLLHTECHRPNWTVVTRLRAPFAGLHKSRTASAPHSLYLYANLPGGRSSRIAVVDSKGVVAFREGPPSAIRSLRMHANGALWASTFAGVFSATPDTQDWTLRLPNRACGSDYTPFQAWVN